MAVYVDQIRQYGGSKSFKWKQSCHMFADSEAELHAFANKIGMKREWFQNDDRLPHYDLTINRRRVALNEGAIQVGWKEVWNKMKENVQAKQQAKGD